METADLLVLMRAYVPANESMIFCVFTTFTCCAVLVLGKAVASDAVASIATMDVVRILEFNNISNQVFVKITFVVESACNFQIQGSDALAHVSKALSPPSRRCTRLFVPQPLLIHSFITELSDKASYPN